MFFFCVHVRALNTYHPPPVTAGYIVWQLYLAAVAVAVPLAVCARARVGASVGPRGVHEAYGIVFAAVVVGCFGSARRASGMARALLPRGGGGGGGTKSVGR